MSSIKHAYINNRQRFVDENGLVTADTLRVLRDIIPSYADSVIPVGVIDGANKVFTLPQAPNPVSSLQLRKRAAADVSWTVMALTTGFAYAIVAGKPTITYVTAPAAGNVHESSFRYLSPP